MNQSFTLTEMFRLGWPILSVLLAGSVISLAIIFERWRYFAKRRVNVKKYLDKIPQALRSGRAEDYAALGEPMQSITRDALTHINSGKDSLELALDRSIRLEVSQMERYVPILGTIAGTAPFVGLLGTVLGIIRAFRSLSLAGSGGPQVVAAGIAEALIATAVGLMVAIPALIAYNVFSTKIRRATESMEVCADTLVDILERSHK